MEMGDISEDVAPNTLLDMAEFKEWLKEKRLKQEREKEMKQIEEQKQKIQEREQQEKGPQMEKLQQQQNGKAAAGAGPRKRTQSFGDKLAQDLSEIEDDEDEYQVHGSVIGNFDIPSEKAIEDLLEVADKTPLITQMGCGVYSEKNDRLEYIRRRRIASTALSAKPLQFIIGSPWSAVKTKATRQLLIDKVKNALAEYNYTDEIALAIILSLTNNKRRNKNRNKNMNIVLNGGTVKRGRPPTHGLYSGKRKKKPEESAPIVQQLTSASTAPVQQLTLVSSAPKPATAAPKPVTASKQVATRVADKHQKPKSNEQVQSEQHAVVALTEPAPVIAAKNVAKKLPALPKQALQYTILVNGVKVAYPFSLSYKEFRRKWNDNDTWYRFPILGSTQNILDDEEKYKNFLSRVRAAMGTPPTMWIHTDKEYQSEDEEYYTVPNPIPKKVKEKEPVTTTQVSKRQVPTRKASVVATENILKTSRSVRASKKAVETKKKESIEDKASRMSSVSQSNVDTRTVHTAEKTGSKKNEKSITSSSKKTTTQETHSSTQQMADFERERTLSAQPEPRVEREMIPPSAQPAPAVRGNTGPPSIPIQPPSKATLSHDPFKQAFMQTQDFAKEDGFEIEKLLGLEDVFTTPPSTPFMPGTQNGSVRKKAHIGRISAQRLGGSKPPALSLELVHDYPSMRDSQPYVFHRYQKKTRQPPKMLIPDLDPKSKIPIQASTQAMGPPPLPANQRDFQTALQYGRQSMELPLNGLMGQATAMRTSNTRMLGNIKIPNRPELIGHPRPSGIEFITHAATKKEQLPVPENSRQGGAQLSGQKTNVVTPLKRSLVADFNSPQKKTNLVTGYIENGSIQVPQTPLDFKPQHKRKYKKKNA